MDARCTSLEPCLKNQLKGHRNAITALCFSPNEQQIVSSSLDNSILLWDLRGTLRSYRFQGHDEAVMDVAFSSSGKYMASASRDKTVRLWVPTVTGSTGMFKAHSQTVRSVQFSSDGSKIVTASDDKIVKLWTTEKHKFLSSYVGHTNWVRCARISTDESIIASCSDDKTTKLWSIQSGECIHTYKDQKGHSLHLAWHPSGCYIAVATSQGNVKLYDIRTHNLVQYYSIHDDAVNQITFHPSGSYILTASKDGKMKILDLLEGHPIFTLSGHTGSVNAVNFSPSGDYFASAGEDKSVFIWHTNFTELSSDSKENLVQNCASTPGSTTCKLTSAPRSKKGTKAWYLCYHSMKYPITTFVHMDNVAENVEESVIVASCKGSINNSTHSIPGPHANSTAIESGTSCTYKHSSRLTKSLPPDFAPKNVSIPVCGESDENSVCDISHIPRIPPSPSTYTIPSIMNRSIRTEYCKEDLFGMIKLKENDVCYTSGKIEWVGRKRSFPINSGFKIINESHLRGNEPLLKVKRLDRTFTSKSCKMKECDCAEVLPTVNAIVDHLNALHEAVDLVDLRLNTIEDVVDKFDQ